MNVSETGAGLFAPTHPWVRVDDMMIVGFNNARAIEDGGSQLVRVTKNPVDGADVTHYKVLNITGGSVIRNASGLPAVKKDKG